MQNLYLYKWTEGVKLLARHPIMWALFIQARESTSWSSGILKSSRLDQNSKLSWTPSKLYFLYFYMRLLSSDMIFSRNFNFPNPSLTPNQTFPIFPPFEAPSPQPIPPLTLPPPAMATAAPAPQHFDLQTALAAPVEEASLPKEADQIILLYTKTQKLAINSNHPMGFINRTSWQPQSPPLISLPRPNWDDHQLIPYIPLSNLLNRAEHSSAPGPWVDLIINNHDDGPHPFHLHGHDFYVLATHRSDHGWGSYSPWSDAASNAMLEFNLERPLRKDTVSVPRRGYAVLRFQAGNEGVWMLHCHVLVHLGSGMAMGLQVGGEEGEGSGGVDVGAGELCV
jgi:hypothetical protein